MCIYPQIFHLKFERHLTYQQIALTLDIGGSTVNDIVTRFNNLNMQWPCHRRCQMTYHLTIWTRP
jgi:hypothetical protein